MVSSCFRPAPPLDEGDERDSGLVTETSTESGSTSQGHPLLKKRQAQKNTATPASTTTSATSTLPSGTSQGGTLVVQATPAVAISSATPTPVPTQAPPSVWEQEAYIKAANGKSNRNFGKVISLNADTLVVGSRYDASSVRTITNGTGASSDESALESGAAFVYRRVGSNWSQEAYIKAVNSDANDSCGNAVAISGDTIAIGAIYESSAEFAITNGSSASSNNGASDSGAVYVYRRSGSNWSQEAFIKPSNSSADDWFGQSVALSGDTLVVGAPYEDSSQNNISNGQPASTNNSSTNSGAAYVFRRSGSKWTEETYLKATNAASNDEFGRTVSISGETIVVGTPARAGTGAAYIFGRNGNSWIQQAYVTAVNANNGDAFANALGVSGDTLVVGAYQEDAAQNTITNGTTASNDNTHYDSGAAYVYRRSGNAWTQEAYIKAVNLDWNDWFGFSVAISGNSLAIGAPYEESSLNVIVSGTQVTSNNSASRSGAVYLYKRSGSVWEQEAYFKAVNLDGQDNFGSAVAVSGDTLAVGAPTEDSNQTTISNGTTASANNLASDAGAVYVYRNLGRIADPDVRVQSLGSNNIVFEWGTNLGTAYRVLVAPVAVGNLTPSAGCAGGTLVPVGVPSYTYSGLSPGSKYGFRFCGWDGSSVSDGTTLWAETLGLPGVNVSGLKPSVTGTCDASAVSHSATTTTGKVTSVSCSGTGKLNVQLSLPAGSSSFVVELTSTYSNGTSSSSQSQMTRTPFICPAGYVGVPASGIPGLGSTTATSGHSSWWLNVDADFCVMKYPAKNNNTSTFASSTAYGSPWVSIQRGINQNTTSSALQACNDAGPGYRLISNTQWQTIARNAENVAENWSGAAVGNGMMARGHSDGTPPMILENSTDDNPYFGTENNVNQVPGSGWEQKRTKILNNGEIVWDMGGNVSQWVSDNSASLGLNPSIPSTREFSEQTYFPTLGASAFLNKLILGPSGGIDNSHGLGVVYSMTSDGILRGGHYINSSYSGLFMSSSTQTTQLNGYYGFRCVYLPQ
jgi:hypothetical protein